MVRQSGIICGLARGSFPVRRSFAVQFGDHFRSGGHLRACTGRSDMGCGSAELSFSPIILHVAIFCFSTFCEAVQTRAAFLTVVILFAKRALCVFGQFVLSIFPVGLSHSGWLVTLFFAPRLLIKFNRLHLLRCCQF